MRRYALQARIRRLPLRWPVNIRNFRSFRIRDIYFAHLPANVLDMGSSVRSSRQRERKEQELSYLCAEGGCIWVVYPVTWSAELTFARCNNFILAVLEASFALEMYFLTGRELRVNSLGGLDGGTNEAQLDIFNETILVLS